MCVEKVTVGSPQWAKMLNRRSGYGHFFHRAVVLRREGLKAFEKKVADPLFVVGNRFDIDQRPCELKGIHNVIVPAGWRGGRTSNVKVRRIFLLALHPVRSG